MVPESQWPGSIGDEMAMLVGFLCALDERNLRMEVEGPDDPSRE